MKIVIASSLGLISLAAMLFICSAASSVEPDALLSGRGHSGSLSSSRRINPHPISECDTPSIDRLQKWLASGEGPTVPSSGSLLVPNGEYHIANARFTSSTEWHVLSIWLGNEFGASIDLTGSSGFTMTYSASADFYIQLRPAEEWSGGNKWHMPISSSGGAVITTFFPFDASKWEQRLGSVPHTFKSALADASGFVIVGNTVNELSFSGLRIDGFVPTCH